MATLTTAAIYCRISQDSEAKGFGVARQLADCEALCAARGWSVAGTYTDNDVSAYSGKRRPEYERMMADLADGKVNAIVASNPDRLHRAPKELEAFIDAVQDGGALVATVTSGDYDLSTADGQLQARIRGDVARHESQIKSERVLRALVDIAKRGGPHGGRRPYGFMPDRVTVDPHEAKIIREAAEAIIAGQSVRSLCLRFNARGDFTPGGKPWDNTTLTRMLVRPRLIGKREHNGRLHDAAWQPILTPAQQTQVRVILDGHAAPVHHEGRKLLSGLVFCAVCGRGLQHKPAVANRRRTYVCPVPPFGHSCVAIAAEALEATVIGEVRRVSKLNVRITPPVVTLTDTDVYRARLDELAAAYARGTIDLSQLETATGDLRGRIADAERRNAESTEAALAASTAQRVRQWDELTDDERSGALRRLVHVVIVHRAKVRRPGRVFDPSRVQIILRAALYDDSADEPVLQRVDGRAITELAPVELAALSIGKLDPASGHRYIDA